MQSNSDFKFLFINGAESEGRHGILECQEPVTAEMSFNLCADTIRMCVEAVERTKEEMGTGLLGGPATDEDVIQGAMAFVLGKIAEKVPPLEWGEAALLLWMYVLGPGDIAQIIVEKRDGLVRYGIDAGGPWINFGRVAPLNSRPMWSAAA